MENYKTAVFCVPMFRNMGTNDANEYLIIIYYFLGLQ